MYEETKPTETQSDHDQTDDENKIYLIDQLAQLDKKQITLDRVNVLQQQVIEIQKENKILAKDAEDDKLDKIEDNALEIINKEIQNQQEINNLIERQNSLLKKQIEEMLEISEHNG